MKTERIAVLDNIVEAQILGSLLEEKDIPHMIRSHYDSAYDGVYQEAQGWGVVEAESVYADDIRAILAELRDTQDTASDDVTKTSPDA